MRKEPEKPVSFLQQVQLKRVKKDQKQDDDAGLEKVDLKSRRGTIDEQVKQRKDSKQLDAKESKLQFEHGEKARRESVVRYEAGGRVQSTNYL